MVNVKIVNGTKFERNSSKMEKQIIQAKKVY